MSALYRQINQLGEAESSLEQALAVLQRLCRDYPEVPPHQQELAKAHHNLAVVYESARRPEQAEAAYQRAAAIQEELVRAHPAVTTYQNELATTHQNLAQCYGSTKQRDKAEAAFQRALAIREELAAKQPRLLSNLARLAGICLHLGDLVEQRKQTEDALAWYGKSIETAQGVLAREPRHPLARSTLVKAHVRRAEALCGCGRDAEGLKDWNRAVELDGSKTASFRIGRALGLARLGEHGPAAQEADALAGQKHLAPELCYHLARVYARAAPAASQDQGLPESDRRRKADGYADQALQLLQRAVAAGYRNAERIRENPDLDALRSRDDFGKLLAELEKPSGKEER